MKYKIFVIRPRISEGCHDHHKVIKKWNPFLDYVPEMLISNLQDGFRFRKDEKVFRLFFFCFVLFCLINTQLKPVVKFIRIKRLPLPYSIEIVKSLMIYCKPHFFGLKWKWITKETTFCLCVGVCDAWSLVNTF